MKNDANVGLNIKLDNNQILLLVGGLLVAIAVGCTIAGLLIHALTGKKD